MSKNRIKEREEATEPEYVAGEYVVIAGSFGSFAVSRAEGARVAGLLARWWCPGWIEFRSTTGSVVRVRSRDINEMYDLSPRIRHAVRAIRRAHKAEDEDDCRRWGDEY